ncbi:DUF2064 domain-containing protein [Mycobacterium sp. MYCO198283]|uniref:TIGR04282 family arsenosugar biosynthesis glycosyltransferase n=1 Tax=Mycobacterium sp. MYCO198283 TaxID=2883505 RepID=UPI001E51A2ED|nr:DUF2064 domain-containing protein [Mycobacterium sp. MYCO198283]MCG5432353.1 DUF2064 domain-containing protein [Mycobacterium sp. MYCO198283]
MPVTALVVAKAPVPGLAKTRLAAAVGDVRAADLAAAALLDSLAAVAAAPFAHRVVAMTGELAAACRAADIRRELAAFTVLPQRGDGFADRLANAHLDTAAAVGDAPILQIGMDTPQVTAELLDGCARVLLDAPAVLGMADDGGWWVLGVQHGADAEVVRDVPMSRADTGRLTREALAGRGIEPVLVEQLRDLDTIDDLPAVRRACRPGSWFARATDAVEV